MNNAIGLLDARSLSRGSDSYKLCIDKISKKIKECANKGEWQSIVNLSGREFNGSTIFDVCQMLVCDGYKCKIKTVKGIGHFGNDYEVFVRWDKGDE